MLKPERLKLLLQRIALLPMKNSVQLFRLFYP